MNEFTGRETTAWDCGNDTYLHACTEECSTPNHPYLDVGDGTCQICGTTHPPSPAQGDDIY